MDGLVPCFSPNTCRSSKVSSPSNQLPNSKKLRCPPARCPPTGLRDLTLTNAYSHTFSLAAATQLTSLRLLGDHTDIDYTTMPPSLHKLFVRDLGDDVVPHLLAPLSKLTRLEELSVHDATHFAVDGWREDNVRAGCRAISSFTRLTHLALTRVGPIDCSFLSTATLPHLRSLWLDMYPPHGISHVPALPAAAPFLTCLKLSLGCASDTDDPLPLPLGRPGAPDLSRYPRLGEVMLHFVDLDAEAALHLCSLLSLSSSRSLRLDACRMADRCRRKLMHVGAVLRSIDDCTDFMEYSDWLE